MREVYVICEGDAEEQFIKKTVAPALKHLSIYVKPLILQTSPGHHGGGVNFDRLKYHVKATLKQYPNALVTTFIDLYALSPKFPKFEEAKLISNLDTRIELLNKSLTNAILDYAKCGAHRFIAHIQPHEFEALLFSDTNALAQTEPDWGRFSDQLLRIKNNFDTPEHINGGYDTCPSRRLNRLLNPKYNKKLHATRAIASVTLTKIEQECKHFHAWLNALRALAS
jgi:Domain of unknown function (DUF4276)